MPDPEKTTPELPIIPEIGKEKATVDILDFNKNFAKNAGSLVAQGSQNPYADLQPASFDPKNVTDTNKNFERYYSHPDFKKLGFNPWSDNEALYNQYGSATGDVTRASIAGMKLAITGFKAPIRSYGDLFAGEALIGDDATANEMRYRNAVGSSTKAGATGFMSNLIVNSGFSVGFMGEALAEQAVLTAATALTGGGAGAAQVVRAAKTAKDFGTYSKIIKGLNQATKTLDSYPAAKMAYDSFKAAGKFINPLENTVSALNASENITGLAKLSNTAAGFFKDISAANFTLSESKVEAATAQMDLEEELVSEFKVKNEGRSPSYDELLQIKKAAQTAGDKTLAFNIPAIYLTNKLTFAPLFNSFSKSSEYILKNGVKFIEKEGEGLVEATFLNKAKMMLKPKNLAKIPVTYFKENMSEGIQETTQEIVSGTAKQYYKDIYNSSVNQGLTFAQAENQNRGVWDALSENATSQFSGKGFETFASGFFMGGLLKVAATPITAIRTGVAEYKKTKSEYTQKALESGNIIYNDPLKFFTPRTLNYSSTANGVENQTLAENENNQKMWSDFEDQNTWSHLTTALDTGTFDITLDKLKSIKTMTPDAIVQAYGQDGQAVLSKIDKIIARAENLKSNYEKWNERASNPFNPKAYKKDTPEYNKEALGFVSWEAAKKSAIFQEYSFNRNVARVSAITDDILKTPEFKNLNPSDIGLLIDPTRLRGEVGLLNSEIDVLSSSDLPGDSKVLRTKEIKRDRLLNFQENLQNYYITQQLENLSNEEKEANPELVDTLTKGEFKKTTVKQLKSAYEKYITHLGTSQLNVIHASKINLDESFDQLLDVHTLNQENVQFTQAINLLSNPKGFTDHYKSLFDTFSELYSNRDEIIKKSIEDTQSKIEMNVGLLTPLFERGFVVDSKNLDALIEKGIIPEEFYDTNAKQVVNQSDPFRYGQFKEIVENYVAATKPEIVETVTQPIELIPNEDWQMFLDTGDVSDRTLELIASTIKGGKTPSLRMTQLMGESAIAAKVESLLKTAVVVETLAPELHIDITSKFDAVTNEEQLDTLEEEMKGLMYTTTLDQRNELGITSDVIEARILEKRQELVNNVTLANLNRGNIVLLKDGKKGQIIAKGKDTIKVRDLENPSLVITILEENLKNTIQSKYSETMQTEKTNASQQEKDNVNTNITKQLKLTDNADALKAIVEEAFADEKKFEQDFINELGCK